MKNFIKSQRQSYLETSKITTAHILIPHHEKSLENYPKDDIYNRINPLSNEIEYIKKYVLNLDKMTTDTNLKIKVKMNNLNCKMVNLNQLLPKSNEITVLKKLFYTTIHKKGSSYSYRTKNENWNKEIKLIPKENLKRKNDYESIMENKFSTEKINQLSTFNLYINELPYIESKISKYFKGIKKIKNDYFK